VELASLDPWVGREGVEEVIGLKRALEETRNWTPVPPPGAFTVVSLAQGEDETPIDPLGAVAVTQRVCPLNTPFNRFGAVRALNNPNFKLESVSVNQRSVPLAKIAFVKEPFAPAQFFAMNDTQKLSSPAFQKYDGGIRVPGGEDNLAAGSFAEAQPMYKTKVKDIPDPLPDQPLPEDHLQGMSRRSAAALRGARRQGAEAYVDPTAPARFTVADERFALVDRRNHGIRHGVFGNKFEALLAQDQAVVDDPKLRGNLQVMPQFELEPA
jgi:hypothetical protein